MIKVDILVRRRPDLTHEQFVEHWRNVHAALFSNQPAVKKYVRRYIQSRTIPNPPEGFLVSDFDGIAQLWFDDMNGFHGLYNSKDYSDVIRIDEQKFTDGKRVPFLFSEETTIMG
jgi:uncharacterized protein (TIGR02118 family)